MRVRRAARSLARASSETTEGGPEAPLHDRGRRDQRRFAVVLLRVVAFLAPVRLRAAGLRAVAFLAPVRLRVVAFLAPVRFLVAAAFFPAADRFAVVRLRVAAAFFPAALLLADGRLRA